MACAAAVARRPSGHDTVATVRKKSRGPGVGVQAMVQEVVLDQGRTGGTQQRLTIVEAGEDGQLGCSGAA
jgi:hypothetical protein